MEKKNIPKIKQFLLKNPEVMHKLASEGLGHFMLFCMSHLFKYPFGIFQSYMLYDTEGEVRNIICPTYPESYAEEIFQYSYVLWSVLGVNKYTNCVIVCGTREKAKEVYEKFKNEFLHNLELRKFDHKVTEESCDGWNIFVPGYRARISIATFPMRPSRFRHKRRSPDIVICNELDESGASPYAITRWMETELYSKDQFYQKTILFGTIKKNDSGLFDEIRGRGRKDKRVPFNAVITPCPLFGDDKECLWDRRYSQKEVAEMLKNWDNEEWQRKYLLHTIETFKVPKEFFKEDGTCDVERYTKYLRGEYRKDISGNDLFTCVNINVAEMRKADEYAILQGYYTYYGTGVVVNYEPEGD